MKRVFLAILIVLFGLGVTAFIRLSSSDQSGTVSDSSEKLSGIISLNILSEHDSVEDCWVGYDGKVYDVTSFLPRHPGSAEAIIPYCGTYDEFTQAFEGMHGVSKVSNLMKVGTLIGDFEIQGEI